MQRIELQYQIQTQSPIPADHGYALYGALSRKFPEVHRENGIAIHPLRGRQIGNRQLALQPWSRLTIRTPAERIAELIQIAGKQIELAGTRLQIGVPEVRPLQPATALRSRLVTIKGFFEPEPMTEAVRRQMNALDISPQTIITIARRRTLCIKHREVVGFEVILEGLTAAESIIIQEHGIGGRRHMGCGIFTALR